jgi:dihydroorotase
MITTSPFIDLHVHAREPGQTHKETVASACAAAFAGGFGAVALMANTSPPVDSPELIRFVAGRAAGLPVKVYPVAAVTAGMRGEELTDFTACRDAGAAALSDDGLPLGETALREALLRSHAAGLPLLLHCEPETEGCERALFYIKQTGCPAHICHVSRRETVSLLRGARRDGISYTAETCPHYMTLDARGVMNPPLGGARDVEAVLDALCDGVIGCIATDHAPHTADEKASAVPPNGVIGLETALAAALEALYHSKRMPLEDIFRLLCDNPAAVLRVAVPDGAVEVDPDYEWAVEPDKFLSKARNTPFEGRILRGRVLRHGC